MSDNDLIRRGDAFAVVKGLSLLEGDILALPAVTAPDRDTFDAMCAMRNAINEYVPMPSLESDLLRGPENSVFCAVVAEAVITEIKRLRAVTAPQGMDDGRPCNTDVFLVAAMEQLDDKWDFFEAVKDWCEGDWDGALTGIELPAPVQPALTAKPVDDSLAADPAVKEWNAAIRAAAAVLEDDSEWYSRERRTILALLKEEKK